MSGVIRVETTDPSQIERVWRETVPTSRLDDIDARRPHLHWASVDLGGVTLFDYELAGRVEASADDGEQFLIGRVRGGDVTLHTEAGELDPALPYLAPEALLTARWEHSASFRVVMIDRSVAQDAARALTGDDALIVRPRSTSPISAGAAAAWAAATDHAYTALLEAPVAGELIHASLRQMLIAVALASFDTTAADGGAVDQRGPAPAALRRALQYIDDNADKPITVADVARAARMSVRGLQSLFDKHLGVSPMRQLRTVRLEGARRDLLAGEPGQGASVATTAQRWGFLHPSRFAAYYQDAFHEMPHETLRR